MKKLIAWIAVGGCVAALFAPQAQAAKRSLELKSPDGHIEFVVSIHHGQLEYQVARDGRVLLKKSPLGIRAAGDTVKKKVQFGAPERYSIDDSYPWYGVHSVAEEHGWGARIPILGSHQKLEYTLEARAYNNGIAFRMTLPGTAARIPAETAAFRPAGGEAWSFDPSEAQYEGVYHEKPVAEVPKGQWMAPPVVVVLPKQMGYLALTEGRLVNYPGMALQSDGAGSFVVRPGNEVPADKALIYYQGQAKADALAKPVALTGPIVTPWRIAMIATTLNSLVNNDIVSDVADAPDPKLFPEGPRTPWVRQGRAVWQYQDDGPRGYEGTKEFSRMAGQLGFQYQVVEGWWMRWSEPQLKELVDYSRQRGVGIWLWKNRRDLETREKREAFFDLCNRVGVVGVKIDFFDSEAKSVIDLYQEILKEAAEHHLLVNFHGSDKPTGEQRTWPNELTREAVEGMEYCCSEGLTPPPTPLHTTTLPFTRLLAGPADYTPVLFDKALHGTTWANQIASAVVLTSPLLTYSANPKTILANPAVDIIRAIPSTWDETIVLPPSRIGKLAIFARRKGDKWFLAAMNGEKPETIDVLLSFLGKGQWKTQSASDVAGNSAAVELHQSTYQPGSVIHLVLRSGGGYVAEFTPE